MWKLFSKENKYHYFRPYAYNLFGVLKLLGVSSIDIERFIIFLVSISNFFLNNQEIKSKKNVKFFHPHPINPLTYCCFFQKKSNWSVKLKRFDQQVQCLFIQLISLFKQFQFLIIYFWRQQQNNVFTLPTILHRSLFGEDAEHPPMSAPSIAVTSQIAVTGTNIVLSSSGTTLIMWVIILNKRKNNLSFEQNK